MSAINQQLVTEFINQHGSDELLRLIINAPERSDVKNRKVVDTTEPGSEPVPAKTELGPPDFALPWTGVSVDMCCKGIRGNYNCYLQCTNVPVKNTDYCKTCQKSADQNNGVPKFGNVTLRKEQGEEFAIDGKKPAHYNTFMKKCKDITQQQVIDTSAKYGIVIDETFFEVKKNVGRPKKQMVAKEITLNALVNDSSDDENDD